MKEKSRFLSTKSDESQQPSRSVMIEDLIDYPNSPLLSSLLFSLSLSLSLSLALSLFSLSLSFSLLSLSLSLSLFSLSQSLSAFFPFSLLSLSLFLLSVSSLTLKLARAPERALPYGHFLFFNVFLCVFCSRFALARFRTLLAPFSALVVGCSFCQLVLVRSSSLLGFACSLAAACSLARLFAFPPCCFRPIPFRLWRRASLLFVCSNPTLLSFPPFVSCFSPAPFLCPLSCACVLLMFLFILVCFHLEHTNPLPFL